MRVVVHRSLREIGVKGCGSERWHRYGNYPHPPYFPCNTSNHRDRQQPSTAHSTHFAKLTYRDPYFYIIVLPALFMTLMVLLVGGCSVQVRAIVEVAIVLHNLFSGRCFVYYTSVLKALVPQRSGLHIGCIYLEFGIGKKKILIWKDDLLPCSCQGTWRCQLPIISINGKKVSKLTPCYTLSCGSSMFARIQPARMGKIAVGG